MFRAFLLLAAMLAVPVPAFAGHVFYYHAFGAWAVACDRDLNDGRRACSMTTPLPSLAMPRVSLAVTEEGPNAFAIKARVTGHVDPAQPWLLGVDNLPPTGAKAERWGEARWTGPQAATLVQAMEGGSRLLLSFGILGNGGQTEILPLNGFGEALAALRHNLRAHGILPARP